MGGLHLPIGSTIREKEETHNFYKQALSTIVILFIGFCLGIFSKYLDYRQTELPHVMQIIDRALDFHNFLGRFAPWILSATCIAVYSKTPTRAAINVLSFFAAMISGYYLYCNFVAGFLPKSYVMIWVGFTILSPFLAFLCWYAKGKGKIALILSSGIIAVFINTTFSYGIVYISIQSVLDVIILLIALAVLRRPVKEMIFMIGIGIVLAVVIDIILPLQI